MTDFYIGCGERHSGLEARISFDAWNFTWHNSDIDGPAPENINYNYTGIGVQGLISTGNVTATYENPRLVARVCK